MLPVLLALAACAPEVTDELPRDTAPTPTTTNASASAPTLASTPPSTLAPTLAPRTPIAASGVTPAPADDALARVHLHAPDVVSGSAARTSRGELIAHVLFERTRADVVRLHASLLADDGTLLATPAPVAVEALRQGPRGLAQLRLPAAEINDRVETIELTLEDADGATSIVFPVPVFDWPGVRDGAMCINELGLNECDLGSFCGPSRRCAPATAPTLARAEAFRPDDLRESALRLTWNDPNGDVDAVEVTVGTRCPVVTVVPLAGRTEASVEGVLFEWPRDVFNGADEATLRLRDQHGDFSAPVRVTVARPAVIPLGGDCATSRAVARCDAGMICTRIAPSSCGFLTCQADVRTCPATIAVTPIDATPAPDGTWVHAQTRTPEEHPRPSLCDRDLGAHEIYRFAATSAGTWHVRVDADETTWMRVTLRTRCAINDVGATTGMSARGSHAEGEITLDGPQDLYILPELAWNYAQGLRVTVSRVR